MLLRLRHLRGGGAALHHCVVRAAAAARVDAVVLLETTRMTIAAVVAIPLAASAVIARTTIIVTILLISRHLQHEPSACARRHSARGSTRGGTRRHRADCLCGTADDGQGRSDRCRDASVSLSTSAYDGYYYGSRIALFPTDYNKHQMCN